MRFEVIVDDVVVGWSALENGKMRFEPSSSLARKLSSRSYGREYLVARTEGASPTAYPAPGEIPGYAVR